MSIIDLVSSRVRTAAVGETGIGAALARAGTPNCGPISMGACRSACLQQQHCQLQHAISPPHRSGLHLMAALLRAQTAQV